MEVKLMYFHSSQLWFLEGSSSKALSEAGLGLFLPWGVMLDQDSRRGERGSFPTTFRIASKNLGPIANSSSYPLGKDNSAKYLCELFPDRLRCWIDTWVGVVFTLLLRQNVQVLCLWHEPLLLWMGYNLQVQKCGVCTSLVASEWI